MTAMPVSPKVALNIKSRIKKYVGTFGLSYLHAAFIINKQLALKKRYDYELDNGKIAGICNRGKIKVAKTVSEEGTKLLEEFRLSDKRKKFTGNGVTGNGTANRLKNARLRRHPQPSVNPSLPQESETIPLTVRYTQKPGKRSFIPARELRERGIADIRPGSHMPEPGKDLTEKDLLLMERYLYAPKKK